MEKHWSAAKMILQGDRKIQNLSLFKLYGELQAQESFVLKDCADLGGPPAQIAKTLQFKTPQYSYPTESSDPLLYDNPPATTII